MKNFKNLIVWQKSMELVKNIYDITNSFPNSEIYGLTSQIRRSAISIPSNIAEGAGRSKKEMSHFLTIAIGSSFELETQLILSKDIDYINEQLFSQINANLDEVQKMLFGLQKSLQ
jgi:four helix bundle protein